MGPGRYLLCPPGAGARLPRADRPPAALCPAPGPWAPPRWTERAAGSLLCLQMGFWCPSPGGCVHPLLSAAFFSSPLLVLYCYESFQTFIISNKKGKKRDLCRPTWLPPGLGHDTPALWVGRAPPAPPSLLMGLTFPAGPFSGTPFSVDGVNVSRRPFLPSLPLPARTSEASPCA